jgi:hypothetical protein
MLNPNRVEAVKRSGNGRLTEKPLRNRIRSPEVEQGAAEQ